MARIAEIERADGTVQELEFPDNTPDSVIQTTVKNLLASDAEAAPIQAPSEFVPIPEPIIPGAPFLPRGVRERISQIARPALEVGGALGGGVLGGATGLLGGPTAPGTVPAGAIAGSGLGFAGGGEVADLLDQFLGLQQQGTLPQELLQAGQRAAIGTTAEAGGLLLGKGIGALGARRAARLTPQKARIEAFEQAGVTPVKPQIKPPKTRASVQAQELEAAKEGTLKKFGAFDDTLEGTGAKFLEKRAVRLVAANKRANRLFDAVNELVPEDTPIIIPKLKDAALDILKVERQVGKSSKVLQDKQLTKLMQDITDSRDLSWRDVDALRKRVGAILREQQKGITAPGFSASKEGSLKRLISAIEDDLTDFSVNSGGEVAEAHKLARGFYGRLKERFSNKTIKKLAQTDPQKMVDAIFKKNSIETIRKVKAASGKKAFDGLSAQFAKKLVDSPKLSTALGRFDDATLNLTFGKEGVKDLRQLATVLESKIPADRGSILGALSQTPVIGAPIRALFEKGSDAAFAAIWKIPQARKLLLRGIDLPPNSPELVGLAAKITALALGSPKITEQRPAPPLGAL